MCLTADASASWLTGGDHDYTKAFNESWGGRNWLDRVGIGKDFGKTDDDDYTEDTDVTSVTPVDTPLDETGFGQGVVGGSSDPSLKRRQRGSKNRLRKLMRKDLKIPTGRSVVSVRGTS